jgi:hypothetical protein
VPLLASGEIVTEILVCSVTVPKHSLAHTHAHTQANTRTHKHTLSTCTRMQITHTCTRTHMHIHTHTHAHTHTHTCRYTHIPMHAHTCTYTHAHTCTYTQKVHTCRYTHPHTDCEGLSYFHLAPLTVAVVQHCGARVEHLPHPVADKAAHHAHLVLVRMVAAGIVPYTKDKSRIQRTKVSSLRFAMFNLKVKH